MATNWRTDPDVGSDDLIPMHQMKSGDVGFIAGNIPYDQYNGITVMRYRDEIFSIKLHGTQLLTWTKYSPLKVRLYKP